MLHSDVRNAGAKLLIFIKYLFINSFPYFFFCNKNAKSGSEMPENIPFYLVYVTFTKVFLAFNGTNEKKTLTLQPLLKKATNQRNYESK